MLFGEEIQYQIAKKNNPKIATTTKTIIYCLADSCFRSKFIAHTQTIQSSDTYTFLHRCAANNFHRTLFELQIIFKFIFKNVENYTTLAHCHFNRLMICQLVEQTFDTFITAAKMQYWWTCKDNGKKIEPIDWMSWYFKLKSTEKVEPKKKCTEITRFFINLITQIFHRITSHNRSNRLCSHFSLLVLFPRNHNCICVCVWQRKSVRMMANQQTKDG